MLETEHGVPIHREDAGWAPLIDPLRTFGHKISNFFSPTSEAASDDNAYTIVVELPGVGEDEIDVSVDENCLMISGEKTMERVEKEKTYYFSERSYGRFQRSFRLPADADQDKIYASYKDGVLTIKVAKLEEKQPTARQIPIGLD
ncbi:MAG: Hsp20/alpha crystallin family protein [Rhodospirillaceae bacterium]|jgi:HSP20 family protein|nr:Hsp20/alpha crystallin family protein [Rhodospirillaceae bacterium]